MNAARLRVVAPMAIEARAVRRGAPDVTVLRSGVGGRRARHTARVLMAQRTPEDAMVVAGFGGALSAGLEPGDVVVADRVDGPDGSVAMPGAALLAALLRDAGLVVHVGPVLSSDHIVR